MSIQIAKRVVPDFPEMAGEAANMVADAEIEAEVEAKAGPAIVSAPEPVKDEKEPTVIKDSDLSVEQLRYLLEQKLLEEANAKAEQKKFVKPPAKAAPGMVWVFNRGPQKFEFQYDGLVYEIDGYEMIQLPERVARHGKKRSLLSLDPVLNKAVFKLSIYETDPIRDPQSKKIVGERIKDDKFGVPLKVVNRTEVLDRSHAASILGDGRPVPTKPRLIQVDGAAEMMSRRSDTYVELE